MTDRGPVNRCSVAGCIVIGYWPEGGTCREHTVNPLTDRPGARLPTLAETWEVDE
jgi:hypothetical protein